MTDKPYLISGETPTSGPLQFVVPQYEEGERFGAILDRRVNASGWVTEKVRGRPGEVIIANYFQKPPMRLGLEESRMGGEHRSEKPPRNWGKWEC